MGHDVTIAVDGKSGLDAVLTADFDAVLMDVSLPDVSGIEVTRQMRALTTVPVIGISAHVQPRDIAACRDAGMVEVLPKPIMPDRLALALCRRCGSHGVAPAVAGTLADLGGTQTQSLLVLMLDRLDVEMPALLDAVAAGNAGERVRIAHQLKGAFGNFDLPDLVALLARVEAGEKAAEGALLPALHRAQAELRRSLAALQIETFMPAAQ